MSDALNRLLAGSREGDAAQRLRDRGLPTPRDEAWKFTSLRPLEKFLADGGAAGAMPDVPPPLIDGARQIIVRNGRVEGTAPVAAREGSAVQDMVAALAEGCVAIAPAGMDPEVVELVCLNDGTDDTIRPVALDISVPAQGDLLLIERHLGDGAYLNAVGTSVSVGDNARLRHVKLQDESLDGFHLADTASRLERNARYHRFILSLGSRLARDEVHTTMAGEGAELRLIGAYAGRGQQHLDHTTHIDHAVPRTTSHEVYKGVLDDSARGVFQGGILVRPGAQKTDGHQLNKALLLSPKAEIDSKPALEIYADDVKCSHGATTGEIEADQLFYLKARGIPEAEARSLLVQAFLDELFDQIDDEGLREALLARLHAKLEVS